MKSLCLVAILIFSNLALASTSVGNGGLLVACTGHDQQDLALLEFVEAKILWDLPESPEITANATNENKIIDFVLKRLAILDPVRAARLKREVANFNSEAKFLPNVMLTPTHDDNSIALPIGCSLQQAVVQISPELPGEKRFNVSLMLWDLLEPHAVDRAGLILHELLYREAIANGQTTSKKTRYLNAYLFSEKMNATNPAQYANLLNAVQFPK